MKVAKSAQKIQQADLGSSMRRAKADTFVEYQQAPSLLPTASASDVFSIEDISMAELAGIAVEELCDQYDYFVSRGFNENQISIRIRDILLKQVETLKLKNIQHEGSKLLSPLFHDLIFNDTFSKFSSLC